MTEHINMTHISKSVTIYGNFAYFINSTFSFTALQEEGILVIVRDLTIENSTVGLRNVAVEFSNCTFINVIITDIGSSDVKTSHIQIDIRHTTFRCDENDQQYPYGIQLHSFSVARLTIFGSSFLGCSIDAYVSNIMVYIVQSLYNGTSLQIRVKSWLKVPSVKCFLKTQASPKN